MSMPCWRRSMKLAKAKFIAARTILNTLASMDVEYHTWRELADAFELDIRDFSVSEVNR